MPLRGLFEPSEKQQSDEICIGGQLRGQRVLVPLLTDDTARVSDQIQVGVAIAGSTGGSIRIEDPIPGDEPTHRTFIPEINSSVEGPLNWARDRIAMRERRRIDGILAARRTERRVSEHVRRDEVDTLLLPPARGNGPLGSRRLRRLASTVNCNVVWINGDRGFDQFASILLPIANGPHSGLATDVAAAIAEQVDAHVDVLHVNSPDDENDAVAQQLVENAIERTGLDERANPWVLEEHDPVSAIVEQSQYYGLTVVGAPTASRLKQFAYGSTSRSIRDRADNMIIAARTATTNR